MYYRVGTITRFLPLYLIGLASKNNRRSIIHLLIETLLIRLIHLPNLDPRISYHAKTSLAFYYYLCNEEEKVLTLLFDSNDSSTSYISYIDINKSLVMQVSGGYNLSSMVSNDIILKELFESESSERIMRFSARFMFLYMMFRMTMNISFIEILEKRHYAVLIEDELRTIDILKKNYHNMFNLPSKHLIKKFSFNFRFAT